MAGRGAGAAPQRIEDEFYEVINKFTNKYWLQFARNQDNGLALAEFQMDDIISDYLNDQQKYQMLSLWKQRNSSIATIPYLNQLADEFLLHQFRPNLQQRTNPKQVVDDVEHQIPAPGNSAVRGGESSNLSSRPSVPAQGEMIIGSSIMAPLQASNNVRDPPHPSGDNLNLRQKIPTAVLQLPVQDNESVESCSLAQVQVSSNVRLPRFPVQHTESDVDSSASAYASNNYRSLQQNYSAPMPPAQDLDQRSIVSNTSIYIHSDESLRQASNISIDFQTYPLLPRVNRAYSSHIPNLGPTPSNLLMCSANNVDSPPASIEVHGDLSLPGRADAEEVDNLTRPAAPNSQSPGLMHSASNLDPPRTSRQIQRDLSLPNLSNTEKDDFGPKFSANTGINFQSSESLHSVEDGNGAVPNSHSGNQTKDYCLEVKRMNVKPSEKSFYEAHLAGNQFYRITHTPKGVVLIINNPVYEDEAGRCRMDKDVRNITTMWETFGCKIYVRTNCTADDIRSKLKKFADSESASQCDFVVVVILASGDLPNGGTHFHGTDGNKVDIIEVLETFSDENSKKLQGIPKLFFFLQFNEPNRGQFYPASVLQNQLFSAIQKMPGMLMSYAVHCSRDKFYNVDGGSWYINAIVHTFMNHAHTHHIEELMNMIEDAMAKKMESTSKVRCSSKSTLLKKLYLFPGFPEESKNEFD